MKRRGFKILYTVIVAVALALFGFAFVACDKKDDDGKKDSGKRSELIGLFESNESKNVTLTNDIELVGEPDENGNTYIYTSSVYPLNTVTDIGARYTPYQRLRLKRDYSYEYSVSITVRIVSQSANVDLAKLEATAYGTFEYVETGDEKYSVTLSDPVRGEESIYGAFITGEGNVYSWKLSSSASYKLDLASVAENEAEFDRYVKGRTVSVERTDGERVLHSDMLYTDFMNDVAPYYSYSSSVTPSEPDIPTPPEPEKEKPKHADMPVKTVSGYGVNLRVGDGIAVCVKTASDIDSITVDGATVSDKENVNGGNLFVYPISYSEFGRKLAISIGDSNIEFDAANYLEELVIKSGDKTDYGARAVNHLAASMLVTAKNAGASITPSAAANSLIFASRGGAGENVYHTDWWLRDGITLHNFDKPVDGFTWQTVPALAIQSGVPSLVFAFDAAEDFGLLKTYVTVGDKEKYAVTPVKAADGDRYTVSVAVTDIFDYDSPVCVTVFDGTIQLAGTAEYSVTRAIARTDIYGGEGQRPAASALFSLVKSAEWYHDRDSVVYGIYPPVNRDDGAVEFSTGEFRYALALEKIEDNDANAFGDKLYVNGNTFSASVPSLEGDGYTVVRNADNSYDVTMDGASIDGIFVTDGGIGKLTVTATGESSINNVIRDFMRNRGTVRTNSDILITGDGTVNVYGNIYAGGKLTVDGATVNLFTYNATDDDSLVCASLEIVNGGKLNIVYVGNTASKKTAVVTQGDIVVDGTLTAKGFLNGVYLKGDKDQSFTVNDGAVVIEASAYGITGDDAKDADDKSVNRQMIFNGGVTDIRIGNGTVDSAGIRRGDVTVDAGALKITADSGYCIEALNPVTIRTVSGRYDVGSIELVNTFFNSWWDVNYAAKVQNMLLDGGSLYMRAMCRSGVLALERGAIVTAQNCDIVIESGQDWKNTDTMGRGINAESGDEVITVTDSAKLVFKNCDVPIQCWTKGGGDEYAKLVNNGLLVVDGYKCGLEPWEPATWELHLTIENNGVLRQSGKV